MLTTYGDIIVQALLVIDLVGLWLALGSPHSLDERISLSWLLMNAQGVCLSYAGSTPVGLTLRRRCPSESE